MADVRPNSHTDPTPGDGGCPSLMELAAYLDGRPTGDSAAVEAHLESCARCLAAVHDVRETLAEQPEALPPDVLERACSLVVEREPVLVLGSADRGWWRRGGLVAAGRWAAAIAACVAVCVAGYRVGTSATTPAASADLAVELSFGLLDGSDPDQLERELFALMAREVQP